MCSPWALSCPGWGSARGLPGQQRGSTAGKGCGKGEVTSPRPTKTKGCELIAEPKSSTRTEPKGTELRACAGEHEALQQQQQLGGGQPRHHPHREAVPQRRRQVGHHVAGRQCCAQEEPPGSAAGAPAAVRVWVCNVGPVWLERSLGSQPCGRGGQQICVSSLENTRYM